MSMSEIFCKKIIDLGECFVSWLVARLKLFLFLCHYNLVYLMSNWLVLTSPVVIMWILTLRIWLLIHLIILILFYLTGINFIISLLNKLFVFFNLVTRVLQVDFYLIVFLLTQFYFCSWLGIKIKWSLLRGDDSNWFVVVIKPHLILLVIIECECWLKLVIRLLINFMNWLSYWDNTALLFFDLIDNILIFFNKHLRFKRLFRCKFAPFLLLLFVCLTTEALPLFDFLEVLLYM